MIRNIIKSLIPRRIAVFLKCIFASVDLIPEYLYWFYYDIFHSSLIPSKESDLANLTITSHVLEKGITMPKMRLGFGYDRVRDVLKRCSSAITNYSENHIEIQSAINDLEQYLLVHENQNFSLPSDIKEGIAKMLNYKHIDTAKCFKIKREDYFANVCNFEDFANQRHSVRWYSEDKIENDVLIKAIQMAQTAPSACNRQSTKVYILGTDKRKEEILKLQTGNRGFGFMADKIILLTADMNFWNYKQRTSAFLDSGVFLQNLLYSLHYYKICACTLNAHLSLKKRKQLREIVNYHKSEIPVVFILTGKAPEEFMIAGSQRVYSNQISIFVD